jgi:hypothetical protein
VTIEERFERIEHWTAGLAEERRKDRQEYRQLWRETQRGMYELTLKIAATNDTIAELGDEMRATDQRLSAEFRAADKQLGERIASLVSAMGEYLAKQKKGAD